MQNFSIYLKTDSIFQVTVDNNKIIEFNSITMIIVQLNLGKMLIPNTQPYKEHNERKPLKKNR